jgi:hypothetical protein
MTEDQTESVVTEESTTVDTTANTGTADAVTDTVLSSDIESADTSKFNELSLPNFQRKIGFANPVSLKKLKKEKTKVSKKLEERQLFYFMKQGQRYLILDPNILDLKDSCSYVSCLLNLCDLFSIKLVECTESTQTTTKPISNELINLLYALPLAVYALTQNQDLTDAKKSILKNINIIEHFALRAQGEIYNRSYTKYSSVSSSFISNYLETNCSPFQKQVAICIRNIIMQECKNLDVDKTSVIIFDDRKWEGNVPKFHKETFLQSELRLIKIIADAKTDDPLNLDRSLSLKEQSDLVAAHLRDHSKNKNRSYQNQILELAKNRRRAVSRYFPIQNPNKLKKVRFSLLFDEFKSRKENYEYLNVLMVVPNERFIPPPLGSGLERGDQEYAKAYSGIKAELDENLASSIMDIFLEQKEVFNSLAA